MHTFRRYDLRVLLGYIETTYGDEYEELLSINSNNEYQIVSVIREYVLPCFFGHSSERQSQIKDSLRYYLTTKDELFIQNIISGLKELLDRREFWGLREVGC